MFYDFAITIPAGTLESSPEEIELKLVQGVIHTVRIDIPSGSRGEVHLIILRAEHQLYPTNLDGTFNTDNRYIEFPDVEELNAAPFSLIARGWSPDADYDHTYHIEIGLVESKFALASLKVAQSIEKFMKLLGIGV